MTSRAEYRLFLRQDNADLRLRKKGYEAGLITKEQYDHLLLKEQQIEREIQRLKNTRVGASANIQKFMTEHGSSTLKTACTLAELICRPELSYDVLCEIDPERPQLTKDVTEQVEINIRYEGYITRQESQIAAFKKLENKLIPADIDYDKVSSLRIEARQKLKKFKPINIGQASRISGVNPADVSVLLVYIDSVYKK
jgi:tRNA uridine 5-carboxymethylaminomethyl modification enzyme